MAKPRVALVYNVSLLTTRTSAIRFNEEICVEGFKAAGVPIVELDEDPTHVLFMVEDGSRRLHALVDEQVALGRKTIPSKQSLAWHLDKAAQYRLAESLGVRVPAWVRCSYTTTFDEVVDRVGLPFYYKPSGGLGGSCVEYVRRRDQFLPTPGFIAQQSIGKPGTDAGVTVVKDQAVAAVWRYALSDEHHQSLIRVTRRRMEEFEGTDRIDDLSAIQEICGPVARAMGNELAYFNLLRSTSGEYYFNEVNHVSPHNLVKHFCGVNAYEEYAKRIKEET